MHFSPKAHTALFGSSASCSRRRKSLATTTATTTTAQGDDEESETLSTSPAYQHPSSSSNLASLQPSASMSWINPFAGRASFSVERDDDGYQPPSAFAGSNPSSRRPSAATIISTLLHGVGVGKDASASGSGSGMRVSQDGSGGGYTSSEGDAASSNGSSGRQQQQQQQQAAATVATGRRPSAIFKAWKTRRTSASTQGAASSNLPPPTSTPSSAAASPAVHAFAGGRRKSSALTRVLSPTNLRNNGSTTNFMTAGRVDEHQAAPASGAETDDARRRSLSIVCRGERDSEELDPSERFSLMDQTPRQSASGVTAAMAIRDTWLYGSHQWTPDGRKGSVSTIATSPSYPNYALAPLALGGGGSGGRKSIGGSSAGLPKSAVGLDMEDQQIQHAQLQERLRQLRKKGGGSARGGEGSEGRASVNHGMGDTVSVVSLSLTEEIALYTSDVHTVEHNAEKARRSANSSTSNASIKRGNSATNRGGGGGEARTNNNAFVWNLPDWSAAPPPQASTSRGAATRLPELSPAPAIMIADPFSRLTNTAAQMQPFGWNRSVREMAEEEEEGAPKSGSANMQRVESGSLDPVLSPIPASSPTIHTPTSDVGASDGHSHRRPSQPIADHQDEAAGAAGAASGGGQWSQPQWNTASPFRPDAPALPSRSCHRPSFAATGTPMFNADDQSPTALNFPLAPSAFCGDEAPASPNEDARRRATTYYDASPLLPIVDEMPGSPNTSSEFRPATLPRSPRSPRSPKSPRSFGHTETSYEMSLARRRTSYSLPRPPPNFDHNNSSTVSTYGVSGRDEDEDVCSEHMPTPRLVSMDFTETTSSPLSSNFAPETPSNVAATFPEFGSVVGDETIKPPRKYVGVQDVEDVNNGGGGGGSGSGEEGDDLHAQFCSVLLLDLGNGRTIPLSPSPGTEPRPDPFTLLAH